MFNTGISSLSYFSNNKSIIPSKSGVYIIFQNSSIAIQRIGGPDKNSIIYIGRTSNLNRRITRDLLYAPNQYQNDWNAYHPLIAHFYEWWHYGISKAYVANKVKSFHKYFSNQFLQLKVSFISTKFDRSLEAALLEEYHKYYGELPPMNFSLPQRYKSNKIKTAGEIKIGLNTVKLKSLLTPTYFKDLGKLKANDSKK